MLLTAGGQPEASLRPLLDWSGMACELGLECSREGGASWDRETGKSHRPEEDVAAPPLSHSRMGRAQRGCAAMDSLAHRLVRDDAMVGFAKGPGLLC